MKAASAPRQGAALGGRAAPPAEARSSTTTTGVSQLPSAPQEGDPSFAASPAEDSCVHASSSLGRRCSLLINITFYISAAVCASLGGIIYGLPPTHWLHEGARKLLDSLSASAFAPASPFRLGPHLKAAAVLLEERGMSLTAARVSSVAEWPHLEVAVIVSLSLLSLCFASPLVRGMIRYSKEREVEVSPPPVRYCQNRMTLEEYRDKSSTYAAVAELMASPEFRALQARRASQGSEAWNWQRRGEVQTVTEDEETDGTEETEA